MVNSYTWLLGKTKFRAKISFKREKSNFFFEISAQITFYCLRECLAKRRVTVYVYRWYPSLYFTLDEWKGRGKRRLWQRDGPIINISEIGTIGTSKKKDEVIQCFSLCKCDTQTAKLALKNLVRHNWLEKIIWFEMEDVLQWITWLRETPLRFCDQYQTSPSFFVSLFPWKINGPFLRVCESCNTINNRYTWWIK